MKRDVVHLCVGESLHCRLRNGASACMCIYSCVCVCVCALSIYRSINVSSSERWRLMGLFTCIVRQESPYVPYTLAVMLRAVSALKKLMHSGLERFPLLVWSGRSGGGRRAFALH